MAKRTRVARAPRNRKQVDPKGSAAQMASNAGQSARQIVVKTKEAMEGGVESMKKFEMPKVTMAQVEDATAIAGGAVHDAGVATGKAATTVARLTGIFVSAMIHGVEEIDENEEEVIEEAAE